VPDMIQGTMPMLTFATPRACRLMGEGAYDRLHAPRTKLPVESSISTTSLALYFYRIRPQQDHFRAVGYHAVLRVRYCNKRL